MAVSDYAISDGDPYESGSGNSPYGSKEKNPISSFPQTIQLFKTIFLNKIYLCLSLIKERKDIMNIKRKL